jgi:predicted GIY-YIG superfamily endonuclease
MNRLFEHNSGKNKSTKRKSGTWLLVYYEAFLSEKDALSREKKLKSHGKSKQELFKRLRHSMISGKKVRGDGVLFVE